MVHWLCISPIRLTLLCRFVQLYKNFAAHADKAVILERCNNTPPQPLTTPQKAQHLHHMQTASGPCTFSIILPYQIGFLLWQSAPARQGWVRACLKQGPLLVAPQQQGKSRQCLP